MVLTNIQMFESVQVLATAKEEKGLLGYAVSVNLRRLSAEVIEFSQKRDELLAKYGTDVGGGKFNFTEKEADKFRDALRPYEYLETDVAVMQVEPDVFYSGGLTSAQMYTLNWMVKEEKT